MLFLSPCHDWTMTLKVINEVMCHLGEELVNIMYLHELSLLTMKGFRIRYSIEFEDVKTKAIEYF